MSKLGDALREKYSTPAAAVKALGLDAALLAEDDEHGAYSEKDREAASPHVEHRKDMPEDAFLLPSERKYPVKEKKDGEWRYDRDLLLGAAREARMHGHEDLANRADEIRKREFDKGTAHDSKEHLMTKPTRLAAHALLLTSAAVRPLLAKDAKIDLMPVFKDVSTKNFDTKKIGIALDEALKGKLAQDADLNDVAEIMHELAELEPGKGADESVSENQHKAMEAAAHGNSTLDIPKKVGEEFSEADKGKTFDEGPMREFCKGKGMGDDDIEELMKMLPKGEKPAAEDEEDEEAKKKADELEKKVQAQDAAMKDMVTKTDMDKAIQAAVAATTKAQKDLRVAMDEVRPYAGEIVGDSAEEVYRTAAKALKIDGAADIHASALPTLIKMQPKIGAQPVERTTRRIAMDEAATTSFNDRFPGASRIGAA